MRPGKRARKAISGGSAPSPLGFIALAPEWMGLGTGGSRPQAIPAAESALRSHPCVAVPSAQVRSVYGQELHRSQLFAENGNCRISGLSHKRAQSRSTVLTLRSAVAIVGRSGDASC
jgi:hypothetical protein